MWREGVGGRGVVWREWEGRGGVLCGWREWEEG